MEMSEWIIQQKEKDKSFTSKRFADEIGMNYNHLINIMRGRIVPHARTALKIEEGTRGAVSGWALQMRAIVMEDEKINKKGLDK